MKAKSLNKVELSDGIYKGRLGGKTVVVRLPENKNVKFEVNYDAKELSIAVFVTVTLGIAFIVSNGYY